MNNFIERIKRYLLGEETASERRDLYEMYDRIDESDTLNEEQRAKVAMRVRRRILQTIRVEQHVSKPFPFLRWISAAAVILAIVGGGYWLTRQQQRPATVEELANFEPDKGYAVIILPTGEEVNLDSIPVAQSIQVGNTIIARDASGEITYKSIQAGDNPIYALQTPHSSISEIRLSDGTKVLLNAASKLYYPAQFGEGDRIVRLEGEAYFQVTKTSSRSRFIVESKDQRTIVLGTKFNVKAYDHDWAIWTTLEEGSVRVVTNQNNDRNVVLSSGQQAVYESAELRKQTVDLESALGWTKGLFYFDGTNTADVLRQIERWYDIDITYKEDKTDAQYSGKIPRNLPLNKLIDLLIYADFKVDPRINAENRINLIIN
ncbi:DUF4974 domain-containing protein [Parapedobacter sp. SGR-10]|nr:DUF4974 domain-containing protein [Parapedobacter sp. SGR-10]